MQVKNYELTIASLNIKWNLSMDQGREDLKNVITKVKPDLIGLQEMHRTRFLFRAGMGYYSYLHLDNDNPIVWNSNRFSLLYSESVRANKTPFYRPGSRKKIYVDDTCVVLYDHYMGRRIHWRNTHTPSNVQSMRNTRRLKVLQECMNSWKSWANRVPAGELRIGTGDFNWDSIKDGYHGSPENQLASKGLLSQWDALGESRRRQSGSFGYRDIDYIFADYHPELVTFKSKSVIKNLNTDHNAAVATINVRER